MSPPAEHGPGRPPHPRVRIKTQPPPEPPEDDASLASIQLKLDKILNEQRAQIAKDTDALGVAIGKAQEEMAAQAKNAVSAVGGLVKNTRLWFILASVLAAATTVGGVAIATKEPVEAVDAVKETVEQQSGKSEEQAKAHDARLQTLESAVVEIKEILAAIREERNTDEPDEEPPEPPKPKRKRTRREANE